METIQIQLPPVLMQRLQQEAPSDETLSQVIAEAIQIWLERQQEKKTAKEKALQKLRQAGVVMTAKRQHTLVESLLVPLSMDKPPTHTQVQASLAKLKVPLSEEIIIMRGER